MVSYVGVSEMRRSEEGPPSGPALLPVVAVRCGAVELQAGQSINGGILPLTSAAAVEAHDRGPGP